MSTPPAARRAFGAFLLLLGLGMAGAGLYLLYGRFAFDLTHWADTPAQGERFRRLEGMAADARAKVDDLGAEVADAKADEPGDGDDEKVIRDAERVSEVAGASVAQVERTVAAVRSRLERRRGRWLVGGILLVVLSLKPLAWGAVMLARQPERDRAPVLNQPGAV